MAQGLGKLSKKGGGRRGAGAAAAAAAMKAKNNAKKAAEKRKAAKAKTVTKGWKQFAVNAGRAKNNVAGVKAEQDTTRAINKRNESLIAAKAVSVGTKFFLSDIKQKGQTEVTKQTQQRNKKQMNSKTKATNRLKEQLRKLHAEK